MKSLWKRALAVALLSAGGAAGVATVAFAGHDEGQERKRVTKFVFDNGGGDAIEIDDLDEIQVGESRTYTTESGKSVFVTRDEKGYELEIDGEKMRIGEGLGMLRHPGPGGPHERMKMRKIELDGDGDPKAFVITDDPEHDVLLYKGEPGEHGFLFEKHAAPPFAYDGLIARLEQNEKFRSLDDATQDLVREAIRESAPEMAWIGTGEGGKGAMQVIVKERKAKEEGADRD